jgi:hypothetical protein
MFLAEGTGVSWTCPLFSHPGPGKLSKTPLWGATLHLMRTQLVPQFQTAGDLESFDKLEFPRPSENMKAADRLIEREDYVCLWPPDPDHVRVT